MTDTGTGTATVASAADPPESAPDGKATPLRWRLAHRPDVRFGHAAGGVAGVLAAAAVVAFVVEVTDDDPTVPGVGLNLLLIAVALAVGFWVRGPVRSAAVAAIAIAVPQVWIFAILGDANGFERGDLRLILALSVASYVGFYLLTWTRGRAILLGLALLFAASWIVFEVASQAVPFGIGAVEQAQSGGLDDPVGAFTDSGDSTTETALADLGVAVVLLGVGVALDRTRRAGAATPCLLVGGLYAVNAAIALGIDVDNVYATGAFVAVAGLAIGLAGSLGKRRGTSWIASVVLLAGVLTVVAQGTADAASGDGSAGVFGGFALVGAAALLVVGILVARALAEPVDGGEPFTPRRPRVSRVSPAPEPAAAERSTEPTAAPAAPPADADVAPTLSWKVDDALASEPDAATPAVGDTEPDASPDASPDAEPEAPPDASDHETPEPPDASSGDAPTA